MPKKSNHHYIPQFYLRRFSIRNEGKCIALFNLKNITFIENAPIKSQACKKFLYGADDEVEDALGKMENEVARFFYFWTEKKDLFPPPANSNAFTFLKQFVLYQAFRVPKIGDEIMSSLNQNIKEYIKVFDPRLAAELEGKYIKHPNPVLFSLFQSTEHEHLLNFMDCKFLVNLSPIPFITSDAPVVFYNQLMEKANNYIAATGLVAKGLQIFYPIHPRLMICLYDPQVYDFGHGCTNSAGTESVEAINQLNGLQLINSQSQLFFDETISEEYIFKLNGEYNRYRGTKKNINKIVMQNDRKFFFTSAEEPHINLKLDVFQLKVNPNLFKDTICPLRHSTLQRSPSSFT